MVFFQLKEGYNPLTQKNGSSENWSRDMFECNDLKIFYIMNINKVLNTHYLFCRPPSQPSMKLLYLIGVAASMHAECRIVLPDCNSNFPPVVHAYISVAIPIPCFRPLFYLLFIDLKEWSYSQGWGSDFGLKNRIRGTVPQTKADF